MALKSRAAVLAHAVNTLGKVLEHICGAVCVFCFVSMTVVALLGVFFRYAMQSPFMWTEELARYLLVWMGFTAISIAMRRGRHIKVEVFSKIGPPVLGTVIAYLADFLTALFMVVLFHQGWLMTSGTIMKAATFNLSMSWILAAVPTAALLTLVQILVSVVERACKGMDVR
jgi:TRAP-type transport system small permease protein